MSASPPMRPIRRSRSSDKRFAGGVQLLPRSQRHQGIHRGLHHQGGDREDGQIRFARHSPRRCTASPSRQGQGLARHPHGVDLRQARRHRPRELHGRGRERQADQKVCRNCMSRRSCAPLTGGGPRPIFRESCPSLDLLGGAGHGRDLRAGRARLHAALADLADHQFRSGRVRHAAGLPDAGGRCISACRSGSRSWSACAVAIACSASRFKRLIVDPLLRHGVMPLVIATHRRSSIGVKKPSRRATAPRPRLSPLVSAGDAAHLGRLTVSVYRASATLAAGDRSPSLALQSFLEPHRDRPCDAGDRAEPARRDSRRPGQADDPLYLPDQRRAGRARVAADHADLSRQVSTSAIRSASRPSIAAIVGGFNQVRGAHRSAACWSASSRTSPRPISRRQYRGASPLIALIVVILFRPQGSARPRRGAQGMTGCGVLASRLALVALGCSLRRSSSRAIGVYLLEPLGVLTIAAVRPQPDARLCRPGVARQGAFFGIGAYVAAILTTAGARLLAVAAVCAGLAVLRHRLALGYPALRVQHHYLAFVDARPSTTLVFLVLRNEDWLTGGIYGIAAFRGRRFSAWSLDGALDSTISVSARSPSSSRRPGGCCARPGAAPSSRCAKIRSAPL